MERPLGGERGLVEAAEDELELSRIGVDVADGENARGARLELFRVGRESRFSCRLRPQSAIGPSFIVRPKNGSMSSQARS